MKKTLKNSILVLALQALLLGVAVSSDRVDFLLEEDSLKSLDSIELKLNQTLELKRQLQSIDFHLAKKSTGESVYLKFERIVGAVVVSGLVAGSASIYFPPGIRAMISAKIVARGLRSGMIELSEQDSLKIRNDLALMRLRLESTEKSLGREVQYYCKHVYYHDLCH